MTPENIAREAAEALVAVCPYGGADGAADGTFWVTIGGQVLSSRAFEHSPYGCRDDAEYDAGVYRTKAYPVILAAVERALREVPVSGPVSDERLAEIRAWCGKMQPSVRSGRMLSWDYVVDLLRHVDHLTRLLQDAAADGLLSRMQEVRDAAFRAGAAAQRAAGVEAARAQLTGWVAGCEDCVTGVSVAMQAVADAPLVEPPV